MTLYKYIVPDQLTGERIDKALSILCSNYTRSQIQKTIKNQTVRLNDKIILNVSFKVKTNDIVEVDIPEELLKNITAVNIPLDIVYEDMDLIVLSKRSNMTVHPAVGHYSDTLVNALLHHTCTLSDIGGNIRPGIVHRLDKDTSGLMVVAKNNIAHQSLVEQIKSRNLIRKYKALLWGMIKQREGTINIPIGRSRRDRKKMTAFKSGITGGKDAITHYKLIEIIHRGLFSFVECKLETGRTHQIRVHMSHIGHSIVCDQTYGNNSRKVNRCPDSIQVEIKKMHHQALHSCYISFIHPTKKVRMEFTQDIPDDYQNLLSFVRKVR